MEKLNLRYAAAVLCLLLAPAAAQAQTYEEILARHPDARTMQVALSDVSAYEGPSTRSRTLAKFRKGDLVVVYEKEGIYYKVALPGRGHVGFVRVNFLRSSSESVPGGAALSAEPRRSVARQEVPRPEPSAQPAAQEPPQPARQETSVIRPQPAPAPRRAPDEIDQAAGGFTIVVASATEQAQAAATLRRYAALGLPSSVLAEEVKGATRYRVAVGQYGSGGEANRARQQLAGRLPQDAWVLRVPSPSEATLIPRTPAPTPPAPVLAEAQTPAAAEEPAVVAEPVKTTPPPDPAVQQPPSPQITPTPAAAPQVSQPSRPVQPERPVSRRSFAHKSGTTATVLNVVLPGAGHLYAGEARRGITLLGLSAGSLSLGLALSGRPETTCTMDPENSSAVCVERVDMKPLYVGAGISALAWLSGILDARASAHRVNVRRQQAQAPVEVAPQLFALEDGTRVGLSVRVGL